MKIKRAKRYDPHTESATFQLTIFATDIRRILRYELLYFVRYMSDEIEFKTTSETLLNRLMDSLGLQRKPLIGRWALEVARRHEWIKDTDDGQVTINYGILASAQGKTSKHLEEVIKRFGGTIDTK